jgi:hypothetical protein
MDQARDACRLRHFSPRTEDAYCHWIRRFIVFNDTRHPATLGAPAAIPAMATETPRATTAAELPNAD